MRSWLIILASTLFARACSSATGSAIDEAGVRSSQEPSLGAATSQNKKSFENQATENSNSLPETPKLLEASLELRRLSAQQRPPGIPRPKGYPFLLGAAAALGHAGYQATKTYNTILQPPAWISLALGRTRFDSTNLSFFTLILGLALLFYGIKRRWTSHKTRNRWRIDELLRQDRIRVEHLRNAAKGGH